MSLSPATLSSIQQAGQAVHDATLAVADSVRDSAQRMVTTIASQPFHLESDQAFERFRAVAKLAHDLQSLEEQLRALYFTASDLVSQDVDVLIALPDHSSRGHRKTQSATKSNSPVTLADQVAEDAVVKSAPFRKSKRKLKSASPLQHLTKNDTKLLAYLQRSLTASDWLALTGAVMAQGAELPLGSVSVSLKKLLSLGLVQMGNKGNYKLAS